MTAWRLLLQDIAELSAKMQPGTVWKCQLYQWKRMHIRANIDNDQIVFKIWSKKHRNWRYYVEWCYSFLLQERQETLEYVGKEE